MSDSSTASEVGGTSATTSVKYLALLPVVL